VLAVSVVVVASIIMLEINKVAPWQQRKEMRASLNFCFAVFYIFK